MSHEPSPEDPTHSGPPSPEPAPGPAFALLTVDGYAVAGTDVFTHVVGMRALSAPAVSGAVAELTGGRSEPVGLSVALPDGSEAPARIEAVSDAHERLLLLEVSVPRPSGGPAELTNWLARFSDESQAIVWLKDMEGRYLQINRQYTEQLRAEPDQIRGRTDAELSQFEAIDGPRSKRMGGPEPVQLEYVIPAFDRRPAYTALRFPIADASGTPVAICGVASPADHAELANAECERLLAALEWLHGDPVALRRTVLGDWGVTAAQSQPGPAPATLHPPAAPPPAQPAPPPAVPPVPAPREQAQPQAPAEFTQLLVSLQRQVSDLEAKVGNPPTQPTEMERLEAQLGVLRAELTAARQREMDAETARQMLETRMLSASEQLGASQAQVAELQAALDASREQMIRLERAAAAATTAAASPITASAPVAASPSGLSAPAVPETPTVARLGWDEGARAALADGLRGCLNVRSIFSEAVRLIGGAGGWDMAVAWLPQDDDGRFGCAAAWMRSPMDMAGLETSMWQLRLNPSASAVGSAAGDGGLVWVSDAVHSADSHLAQLGADGLATVVLLPVRRDASSIAVIELASIGAVQRSPAAEAVLASIATEVAGAYQRVTDTANASQWGRRSR